MAKKSSTKRKARTPTKSLRAGRINFSDFQPEDFLKTEERIQAFEAASTKTAADAAFVAIVDDIVGRARRRLKRVRRTGPQ